METRALRNNANIRCARRRTSLPAWPAPRSVCPTPIPRPAGDAHYVNGDAFQGASGSALRPTSGPKGYSRGPFWLRWPVVVLTRRTGSIRYSPA